MRRALVIGALLALACSDPAPPPSAAPITSATEDGIRVRVGGREVVVHCALTCPTTETELTRLSADCTTSPASGPHRVATSGPVLTLGCCQEAVLAYDRACGHEALPACANRWETRCEGTSTARPIAVPDDERGVTTDRGPSR